MFYKNNASKIPKPKVRRSQVITTFGPGALFNLENGSFIAMGIDSWQGKDHRDILHEDRLEKRLGVQYFKQPSSAESLPVGIPYRRFPQWLFCPNPGHRWLKKHAKWAEASQ